MSGFPDAPPPHTTAQSSNPGAVEVRPGTAFGLKLADWPRRTVATAIDVFLTLWLPGQLPANTVTIVLCLALVGFNSVFMQSRTGQSLGKVLVGIHLVWPADQDGIVLAYPPLIRCLLRVVAHALDLILFIGFLRPLWNSTRQTFADSITKTLVMQDTIEMVRVPVTAPSVL